MKLCLDKSGGQERGTRVPWQVSAALPDFKPCPVWPSNSSYFGIVAVGIACLLEKQPNCPRSSPLEGKVNKEEISLYKKPNSYQ